MTQYIQWPSSRSGGGGGGPIPNSYYVSIDGDNTTGNGSPTRPWLTIAYALSQITDAANDNPYVIFVLPGDYSAANFTTKSYVTIIGYSPNNTFIGNVSGAGGVRISLKNIWAGSLTNISDVCVIEECITGSITQSVNTGTIYLYNTQVYGTLTILAGGTAEAYNCPFLQTVSTSGTLRAESCKISSLTVLSGGIANLNVSPTSAFPTNAGTINADIVSQLATPPGVVNIVGRMTILSIGAIDGQTAATNGATLTTDALFLQSATTTKPGLVNNTTQSFSGAKTFTGAIAASNFTGSSSGANTGDVTLAAVGAVPNANGASLSGQVLTLQAADGSSPGLLTAGVQTIGGAKTFSGAISASNLSGTNTGDVTIGTGNGLSLVSQALSLALSSTATVGALSAADWNTFNGKQAAGSYITALTGDITASGPGSAVTTYNGIVPLSKGGTGLDLTGKTVLTNDNTVTAIANKTFATTTTVFADTSAPTKTLAINLASATAGNLMTLASVHNAARQLTLPNGSGILGMNSATDLSNLSLAATVAAGAMTFDIKTGTGSTPAAGSGTPFISRRSTTATVGTYTVASFGGSDPFIVSSGSTLGQANGQAVLYVYWCTDGTSGLCISSSLFDEGSLQNATAEGGSGGADSFTVLYSGATRTSAAIRLIARVKATHSAGVWSSIDEISLYPSYDPMTLLGDIVIANATGMPARLAGNITTTKKYLGQTGNGSVSAAPSWDQPAFSELSGTAAAAQVVTATFTAPTVQRFTTGSGTYTLPTSPRAPLYIKVKMVAGGAGGAGGGTAAGTAAGDGTSSTFGSSLLTATGGVHGTYGAGLGGAGGTTTVNSPAVTIAATTGGDGGTQVGNASVTGLYPGGTGGASFFGGGGYGGLGGATAGVAGKAYGSGGGGGSPNAAVNAYSGPGGGAGGYIEALITSPSSTYSYSVGAKGSAGGGGTGGSGGGTGADGIIIVEEYYQ